MILSLSLLGATALTANTTFAAQELSSAQKQEVQQIVHDYLLSHPEMLIQMSQKLQQQQMQKVANIEKQAQAVIPSIAQNLFHNKISPVGGNANGTVTLIEFFDYQCPHCKDMTKIVDNLAKQNSNLRIVYKEYPIFGGASEIAAKAALAANQQGKYTAFHDALMNTKGSLSKAQIISLAKDNGLDVKALEKAMDSDAITQEIKQNQKLAKKLKLMGTPAFIIGATNNTQANNTILIPGTTSEQVLQKVIAQVTSKASS
tara:strand:+ start:5519 stop:6295 length:777 start_codon:yes stop_codon:yes gene_type:complete